MSNRLAITLAVCGALASASSGKAQQQVESYVAFLSEADHFNSSGERLRTAAAIIRQDRANFHRFGRRDQADESDSFFADAACWVARPPARTASTSWIGCRAGHGLRLCVGCASADSSANAYHKPWFSFFLRRTEHFRLHYEE